MSATRTGIVDQSKCSTVRAFGTSSSLSEQNATASSTIDCAAQMNAIEHHPLFPIAKFLFLKCEEKTACFDICDIDQGVTITQAKQHVQMLKELLNNPTTELDHLMIDVLYVLRVQLAELHEVCDLSKVFVERYKETIRTRLTEQHEEIFGQQTDSDDEALAAAGQLDLFGDALATMQTTDGGHIAVSMQQPGTNNNAAAAAAQQFANENSVNENGESLDLSNNSKCSTMTTTDRVETGGTPDSGKFHLGTRRSGLPKAATETLRTWLFRHAANPYPTDAEKDQLSEATNLSSAQINNWFINARRRILQPVLNSSGLYDKSDSEDGGTESPGCSRRSIKSESPSVQ